MSVVIKNTFLEFFDEDSDAQEDSMGSPTPLRRNASEPALETGVFFSISLPKVMPEDAHNKLDDYKVVECRESPKEMLEPEWEPETAHSNTDGETTQSNEDVNAGWQMAAQCKLATLGADAAQKRRRRRRRGSLIDVAYWNQKRQEVSVRFCPWCGADCDENFSFCRFCGRAV
jgi:hypothetical protein